MDKRSLPFSVILGALLVPLAAVASVAIIQPSQAVSSEPTTAGAPIAGVTAPSPRLADDISRACGPAGQELAELERAALATPIQLAALDALRPVCEAVGMSLPGPASATVSEPVSSPPPAQEARLVVPVTSEVEDHDDHDDEYEYEYEDGEWEVDD